MDTSAKQLRATLAALLSVAFLLAVIAYKVRGQNVGCSASVLCGTTGSIGGSLLLLNGTTTGTATVTGAVAGQTCIASASDGTNMLALGLIVRCDITSTNTATVTLYAIVSLTPASKTYNVRVLQ